MIEVGEYVRTKKGYIGKCNYKDVEFEKIYGFDSVVQTSYEHKLKYFRLEDIDENILKHSKNIIDLIEVGDYVNGYIVEDDIEGELRIYINRTCPSKWAYIETIKIKSIVTKEQFTQAEYKIKEDK